MLAIYHAAKRMPPAHRLEDTNYINSPIGETIRATVSALRSRPNITTLEWVKGHANVLGNEKADELAVQGANAPTRSCPTLLPEITHPHGAKLEALSQSTALKLRLVQLTLEDYLGISPPITTIWNTTLWTRKNAPPNIRSFQAMKIVDNALNAN